MDPLNPTPLSPHRSSSRSISRTDLFSITRAEQLSDRIFTLFTKPAYFPELETNKACVLVGGRGTGKTTVLRCLSYEGKFELSGGDPSRINDWEYIGLYYRANTNRVASFEGDELSSSQWRKLFAHYINLILCLRILEFLSWHRTHVPDAKQLERDDCERIASSLCLGSASSTDQLHEEIKRGLRAFESFLNNLDSKHLPNLSLQAQPIDELTQSVLALSQFREKTFFFIIDEFENLLDAQQEVLNTIIKHSEGRYTFKIGVREFGWRVRRTINPNETLNSPADFALIDIGRSLSGRKFESFARDVCNTRGKADGTDVEALLPGLTPEAEAARLGVGDHVEVIFSELRHKDLQELASLMSPLELFFARFWAEANSLPVDDVIRERRQFPVAWETRYQNYKFAALFTIRRGRVGISKYYCGWKTYTLLANGNIRYLLELVGQARTLHRQSGAAEEKPIDPALQTKAAQLVGQNCLSELEGVKGGAGLTRLLLGLGRIFEVMAARPEGHTPELTQFYFPAEADASELDATLMSAVTHQALVRSISSKRDKYDLKAFDYAIHPIYSPFFVFSPRRKRKFLLTVEEFQLLLSSPRDGIDAVLSRQRRVSDEPLPEQLQLFSGFYGRST